MHASTLIDTLTGHRDDPEHLVTPDDEMRAFATLVAAFEELYPRITADTQSRTRACAAAQLVERAHRAVGIAQLTVTETVQRSNAHQLTAESFTDIKDALKDLEDFADGVTELPEEPRKKLVGRPTFKDTVELLQNILRIGFYEARDRVRAATHLLPHTDADGIEQPPTFPVLGKELTTGDASPTRLARAAKKFEELQPDIKQYPNADALSDALESQIAESVREQDPRNTSTLFTAIEVTLEKGTKEPSEETLRQKTGLFYRGAKDGIAEFLLKVRTADAELLHSLCAQMDNPRTNAGDRDALKRQASDDGIGVPSAPDLSDIPDVNDVPHDETALPHDDASLPGAALDPADSTETQANANKHTANQTQHDEAQQADVQHADVQHPDDADQPSSSIPHEASSKVSDSSNTTLGTTDFPDFLVDATTGKPFSNPADIQKLTMEPAATDEEVMAAMNNTSYGPDGLTPPQRHLQGIINLLRTNGRATGNKKVLGLPAPEMVIYTTLAELEGKAIASGIGLHGGRLSPAELRQQLCNANVIPAVMNGKSQVLDLGTAERFFPEYMRKIILGIYGGCAVPGCTVPPEHCEIHHVRSMSQGGTTDINEGLPGCSNHHHGYHTGLIKIVKAADGLYSVIMPYFIDPEQKPRRNTYRRQTPQDPTLF